MTPNNKSHRPREIPAEIPTPLQIQDAYKAGNHRRAAELAVIAYHHPPRPTVAAEQKQQLKELRAERGWVVVDVDVGGERLRVATWNFCPPAVVERPRREGEDGMKDQRIEKQTLQDRRSAQEKGTVLLSHGYTHTSADMLSFVAPLVQRGYRVIALDHVAHGESEGEVTTVNHWVETIRVLIARETGDGRRVNGLVGFSGGATAAVLALAEGVLGRGARVVDEERGGSAGGGGLRVVGLGMPTSQDSVMGYWIRTTLPGLSKEEVREFMQLMYEVEEEKGWLHLGSIKEIVKRKEWDGLKGCKVLFVQDENDRVTSVEGARWLADHIEDARVDVTRGLKHEGCLRDEGVMRRVVDWVGEGGGESGGKAEGGWKL